MTARQPIRFGLVVQAERAPWPEMAKVWRLAERLGYESVFSSDHMMPVQSMDQPDIPCMDGWTVVSAMAALTQRVRLGVMVTGVTYRHPGSLAKIMATVDQISNGRLILGIGAAWHQPEHTAYGIPFYPNAERIARLREAVQIIKALSTQRRTDFRGRYYQLADAPFSPKPVQQPHPPIWIGGWGEKLTLKVVAELADGWNTTGSPLYVTPKVEALRRHCEAVRRDFGGIVKSVMPLKLAFTSDRRKAISELRTSPRASGRTPEDVAGDYLLGTPAEMREQIGRYIDLGFSHFAPNVIYPYDEEAIQRFAEEVAPAFR